MIRRLYDKIKSFFTKKINKSEPEVAATIENDNVEESNTETKPSFKERLKAGLSYAWDIVLVFVLSTIIISFVAKYMVPVIIIIVYINIIDWVIKLVTGRDHDAIFAIF